MSSALFLLSKGIKKNFQQKLHSSIPELEEEQVA
jgi:hypothetical protein